jgi:hypothetical protein
MPSSARARDGQKYLARRRPAAGRPSRRCDSGRPRATLDALSQWTRCPGDPCPGQLDKTPPRGAVDSTSLVDAHPLSRARPLSLRVPCPDSGQRSPWQHIAREPRAPWTGHRGRGICRYEYIGSVGTNIFIYIYIYYQCMILHIYHPCMILYILYTYISIMWTTYRHRCSALPACGPTRGPPAAAPASCTCSAGGGGGGGGGGRSASPRVPLQNEDKSDSESEGGRGDREREREIKERERSLLARVKA